MADNRKYIQGQKYQLAGSGISSSDTSLTLESFKFPGTTTTIVTADIGSLAWCTLEPGTEREEIITFTTITQNSDGTATLSGITRGIGFNAPYTTTAALQKSHGGGTTLIITNNPGFYDEFANKNNDETVAGYWEVANPITAQGIVPRDYMLGLINGGAVSTNALIETGTAGETVAAGNIVYLKAADSRWWKADADLTATIDNIQLGIAQGAGTAGASITGGVLRRGVDSNQSGMAVGLAYISNTAGALATTTGTIERVVGNFLSATTIDFDPNFYYLPTANIKAASAGTVGIPASTNKFATADNISVSSTDQTQTTQDSSVETGEANTTTKKNKIAQSFIPARTKIRGVYLNKQADTGTFTGSVTVELHADTTGSPSGTPLATVTITNTEYEALATGEFLATFTSEYASMVVGSLYWIVAYASTSDSSNHPNLGTNTAGGYSSGSVKYYNVTDSWVAISTIDLYFKTLEGNASQLVKTNASGKIESDFYDVTEMPVPAFQQIIPATNTNSGGVEITRATSNEDGSVAIILDPVGTSGATMLRLERDSITGQYFATHGRSQTGGSTLKSGVVVLGDYVYFFYDAGATIAGRRLDLATLQTESALTLPSITSSGAAPVNVNAFTDGKYIYVQEDGGTTFYKLSVSGTTLTTVSTLTANTAIDNEDTSFFFDGKHVVACYCVSGSLLSGNYTKFKFTDPTAAPTTSTFGLGMLSVDSLTTAGKRAPFIAGIDATRIYIGQGYTVFNNGTDSCGAIALFPITKPS